MTDVERLARVLEVLVEVLTTDRHAELLEPTITAEGRRRIAEAWKGVTLAPSPRAASPLEAAVEGETPLIAMEAGMPEPVPCGSIPTPAPASGEEDEVIVKALVIAAKRWERSKDYGAGEKLEAFERRVVDRLARLTRELAEARAELVKTQELLGISVSRTTAARAEAARLRGALEQVVGIADSTANAWDRDDVRDEYRRGQVRGAVDAARPAVRALGGTDA